MPKITKRDLITHCRRRVTNASTETALRTACRVMHVLTETSLNRKKGARTMTIDGAIRANSIGRLGECFEDWLKENEKPLDEPITPRELAEFFEYIENTLREGR